MWIDQKSVDPARVMNLSVGLVSPLWPTYFAAATTGLAYWWLAGLARQTAVNEAVAASFGATPTQKAAKVIEAEVAVVEDATVLAKDEVAVLEAAADLPVEAEAPEPAILPEPEPEVQAAPETVLQAAPAAPVKKPAAPRKPRAPKASAS